MLPQKFVVISQDTLDDFGVDVVYIKLYCRKHGNTWGASIYHNYIPENKLICGLCWQEQQEEQNQEKPVE